MRKKGGNGGKGRCERRIQLKNDNEGGNGERRHNTANPKRDRNQKKRDDLELKTKTPKEKGRQRKANHRKTKKRERRQRKSEFQDVWVPSKQGIESALNKEKVKEKKGRLSWKKPGPSSALPIKGDVATCSVRGGKPDAGRYGGIERKDAAEW